MKIHNCVTVILLQSDQLYVCSLDHAEIFKELLLKLNLSLFCLLVPEQVSNITAIGTTTSLTVSWTEPEGQVSSYSASLYNNTLFTQPFMVQTLSKDDRNTMFQDLKPGVLYCVKLVTISGPAESNHATLCNATCE